MAPRDDLVGRGRAIEHEVGAVGAEDARRVPLRFDRGADVDQQVAELDVGIAQIIAEDLLAEVLVEELTGGRLAVELTALVSRAGKGNICLGVVRHEAAEERRQQAHAVVANAGDDLLGVERGRLLAEIDEAVDFADDSRGDDVGDLARVGQRPDGRAKAEPPHAEPELARLVALRTVDVENVRADVRVFGEDRGRSCR